MIEEKVLYFVQHNSEMEYSRVEFCCKFLGYDVYLAIRKNKQGNFPTGYPPFVLVKGNKIRWATLEEKEKILERE